MTEPEHDPLIYPPGLLEPPHTRPSGLDVHVTTRRFRRRSFADLCQEAPRGWRYELSLVPLEGRGPEWQLWVMGDLETDIMLIGSEFDPEDWLVVDVAGVVICWRRSPLAPLGVTAPL